MALYIGFYRPNEHYQRIVAEKIVSGEWTVPSPGQPGSAAPAFNAKVSGFPAFLESRGVRLIGSYGRVGFGAGNHPEGPPGVTIIETDNEADLAAINSYYNPYLFFSFYRYNAVART